jgi:small-conductance mechanosensitive channel
VREWFDGLSALELGLYSVAAAFALRLVLSRTVVRLTSRTKTEVDDRIVAALRPPVFLTVLLVGLGLALRRLETPLAPRTLLITTRIMITLGTLSWMRGLMRVSDAILDLLARRVGDYEWIQPRSLPLYEMTLKLLVLGVAVYSLMLVWKIDVTAWLASAGIIGIAVGFAARDTLANLFAGIFILADAPYKLGDFIILDSGERGRVTDIGLRSTRLLTRDDVEVTLPNAVIANAKIINESGGPYEKERVRVEIGVAYGSDIDRVREVLLEVAKDCNLVADAPPPSVRFRQFGDSALVFQLRGWIAEPVQRGRAVDRLCTGIYKRFQEEGIEIPFPQRVVHMERS